MKVTFDVIISVEIRPIHAYTYTIKFLHLQKLSFQSIFKDATRYLNTIWKDESIERNIFILIDSTLWDFYDDRNTLISA